MLKDTSRFIRYYRLRITSKPDEAGAWTLPLRKMLRKIEPAITQGSASKLINHTSQSLRVQELRILKGSAAMLVTVADKTASDPTFENLTTGTQRDAPKVPGEGVSAAAQVLLDLNPGPDGRYLVAFESVVGVTKTRLSMLLDHLFRMHLKQTYKTADGNTKPFRPYLEFQSLVSDKLTTVLQNGGTITEIAVEGHQQQGRGFDSISGVTQKGSVEKLRIVKGSVSAVMQAVGSILRTARKDPDWTHATIRYKTSFDKSGSVRVPTHEDIKNAELEHWTMVEGLDPPLSQSRLNLHKRLHEAMVRELRKIKKSTGGN